MDLKNFIDPKSIKELSLSTFYYISGTIIGPLLLFGGLGYLLDIFFKTRPKLLIAGVFVAFVTTNILLFRKTREIISFVNHHSPKELSENEDSKDEALASPKDEAPGPSSFDNK